MEEIGKIHSDGSYTLKTGSMALTIYPEPAMTYQGEISHIAWLENKEGEGMGLRSEHLEEMLSGYFRENF